MTSSRFASPSILRFVAVWGPGLLVMLADTDVGNIVTASQSGLQWGYRLLPLVLLLIPLLTMVQELAVRLGVHTGMGFAELVRQRYGRAWTWVLVGGLVVATTGSLITEFTGFAGVGELYGVSRYVTLSLSVIALLGVVMTGSYRRVERVALVIGMFELTFLGVAWMAHPSMHTMAEQVFDMPVHDHEFLYLGAAIIGSTFNPWMIFYQQSAVVDKGLKPADLPAERWDTALGAVLTQLLTAAVLVAVAATLGPGAVGHVTGQTDLNSVGQVSEALTPLLSHSIGRFVFSMGILGAAMVAAIVCSLAMAWGMGEALGLRRTLENRGTRSRSFTLTYAASVCTGAILVSQVHDLVWLNIAIQVANAFMLPLMAGMLIWLAHWALPPLHRLRGPYLAFVGFTVVLISGLGAWGGLSGLF